MKICAIHWIVLGNILITSCNNSQSIDEWNESKYVIQVKGDGRYERHILPEGINVQLECKIGDGYWMHMNLTSPPILQINNISISSFGSYYCCDFQRNIQGNVSIILLSRTYIRELNNAIVFSPRLYQRYQAGFYFVLKCPIDVWKNLPVWYHNTTEITSEYRQNFKKIESYLIIENMTAEDEGSFSCGNTNISNLEDIYIGIETVDNESLQLKVQQPFVNANNLKAGQNITLKCSISNSTKKLKANWFRHRESIMLPALNDIWLQMRFLFNLWDLPDYIEYLSGTSTEDTNLLSLDSLTVEDEGWYTCMPRNSFTKPVSIYLRISKGENSNSFFTVFSGANMNLLCPVNKTSSANITWTKNGKPINRHIGSAKEAKWSLNLDNVIGPDSGNYTCRQLDHVNHNFNIEVISRIISPPIFSDKFPNNQSVKVNSNVAFDCSVFSNAYFEIRWVHETNMATINWTKSNPHLILTLKNVQVSQSGWYHCYASNLRSIRKRSFYLTVSQDTSPGITTFLTLLIVMIAIAFITVLILKNRSLKNRLKVVPEFTKKVIIISDTNKDRPGLKYPHVEFKQHRRVKGFHDFEFPLDLNWEIPRHKLKLGTQIGEGAFGRVFTSKCLQLSRSPNTTIAAVKEPKQHTDADIKNLVEELEVLKLVGKHHNVIKLLGCCTHEGPLWVVMEYAVHGNLKNFLERHKPSMLYTTENKVYLDDKQFIKFAYQIAHGMEYLASRRIIHRDLAARNILVSEGLVMKISDFGLARDIKKSTYYRKNTNGLVPVKWMAPECLIEKYYNYPSDVWSFGVVLWEITSYGENPYPHIKFLVEMYNFLNLGNRLERPDACSEQIFEIMQKCWLFNAEDRPTFSELVSSLDNLLKTLLSPEEGYLELVETPLDDLQKMMSCTPNIQYI